MFTKNDGQWKREIQYAIDDRILVGRHGLSIRSGDKAIDSKHNPSLYTIEAKEQTNNAFEIVFENMNSKCNLWGENKLATLKNFYYGNDKLKWRENVPSFVAVNYMNVWKNINIKYRISNGKLQQTVEAVDPLTLSSAIFRINGAKHVVRKSDGSLEISSDENQTILSPPKAKVVHDGDTLELNASFKIHDDFRIGFSISAFDSAETVFVTSEFSSYLGGNSYDTNLTVKLDSAENFIVCGNTSSIDFPVKNEIKSTLNNTDYDYFISKYSCDYQNIIFSTYFGGSSPELDIPNMTVGKSNSIYIAGRTGSRDLPIAGKALMTWLHGNSDGFLCKLNSNGQLLYSSYLDISTLGSVTYNYNIKALRSDSLGNIFIAGTTSRYSSTFILITKNSFIDSPKNARSIFVTKLNPDCDTVLYGTYFNGTNDNSISDIAIDGSYLYMTGYTSAADFPLANALQTTVYEREAFVSKLDINSNTLVYSTLLGGFGADEGIKLLLDKDKNLIVAGYTWATDFPTYNPVKQYVNDGKYPFIVKMTPTGKMVFGSLFIDRFSDEQEYINGLEMDACGNLYLSGITNNTHFPFVNPRNTMTTNYYRNFIIDFDTAKYSTLFSTVWGVGLTQGYENMALTKNRYLYLVGTTIPDGIPTFQPFQATARIQDGFIARLRMPTCDSGLIRTTIKSPDTILVDAEYGYSLPKKFKVEVEIENIHQSIGADSVRFQLFLPRGMYLDPPTQQSYITLSPPSLAPTQKKKFVFQVACNLPIEDDTILSIRASALYHNNQLQSCTMSHTDARKDVFMNAYQSKFNLSCLLLGTDSLTLNSSGVEYEPNPFEVKFILRNGDTRRLVNQNVEIQFPKDINLIPTDSALRRVIELMSADSQSFAWKFQVRGSRAARTEGFIVTVIDSMGRIQAHCERKLFIPGFSQFTRCLSSFDDTIKFNSVTMTYSPNPIRVTSSLENLIDTSQFNPTKTIGFQKAHHLKLTKGETSTKNRTLIFMHAKEPFEWSVELDSFPRANVSDTMVFRSRTDIDTTWRECNKIIFIEKAKLDIKLACTLNAPDSLMLNTAKDSYTNNPFAITYQVKNIGQIAAATKYVELQMPQDKGVSVVGNLRKQVSGIGVQDSVVESWQVRATTSRYWREILFRVVTLDTAERIVSSCEKRMLIPPVSVDLSCNASGIDTLHYNSITKIYEPDIFSLSLLLTNRLDTLQYAIEAMIDLTNAKHLTLLTNDTLIKQRSSIAIGGSENIAWSLRLTTPTDEVAYDTITLRYRTGAVQEWKECRWIIAIEAVTKYAKASCIALGQDSVWYDHKWERYIPDPILVTYTITNTGTMTLSTCSAAIVLPKQFTLVSATDSIQTYSPIQSGKAITRSWLLIPTDIPQDTTVTISWQWSCKEFAGDTTCMHSITLTTKDPNGLVITPWHLRFRAEQQGPLPLRQQVTLWTSLKSLIPWQTNMTMSWLSALPTSGDKEATIDVQPTTTNLPLGTHSGLLSFTPSAPFKQIDIGVEYEIYTLTLIPDSRSPSTITLMQNYPNPVVGGQGSVIGLTIPTAGRVELKVYDLLGREVTTLVNEDLSSGSYQVRFTAEQLGKNSSGVFFYVLRVDGKEAKSRAMVVRE